MFDGSFPEIADLTALDDAALVEAAGGWARAENAACARKLAVLAELFARRTGLPAGDRELWWVDPQAAVAAELAAAVNVSQGMATHQTHRGVALRERLPMVAALFEAGRCHPSSENLLERPGRLVGSATARRNRHLDFTDRAYLTPRIRAADTCSPHCAHRPPRCGPATHPPSSRPQTAG